MTSSPGIRVCGDFPNSDDYWWNCPDHIWDDQLGVSRARIYGIRDLSVEMISDWMLVARNGETVSLPAIPLKVPGAGTILVWRETIRDSAQPFGTPVEVTSKLAVQERTWEILQHPDDSADWVRLRIRETVRNDSANHDSVFDLRLNPMTLERVPSRGEGVATPDEGWWMDWADSLAGQVPSRFRLSSFGNAYRHWSQNHSSSRISWMRIAPDQQMDSLEQVLSTTEDNGGAHSWSRSTFTRVLMSVDGKAIRPAGKTGLASARRNVSFDLATLVHLYPSLPVRWRDAQGRSGQIPASSLVRSGGKTSRGVLFLSAILPEGSRWQGACMAIGN